MANKSLSSGSWGSGTSSYGQYTSLLHIGNGHRSRVQFDFSGIPIGSKINSATLYMTHSSSIYQDSQYVSFSASSSGSWSYSSAGGDGGYSSQSSGLTYSWSATSLASALLPLRGSAYVHMSSSDSYDRTYSGCSMSVNYTEPVTEKTYTVTLHPGSYGSGSSTTLTKTEGKTLTLPDALFTRAGYTQMGWSTSTYGTSNAYSLGGSYTTDADIALYPYWVSDGPMTYTVTCRPGANGAGSVKSYTKTEGVKLTLPGALYTREGYTQTGWSTSDGGAKVYSLGGSYTANAAVTLYPYWTEQEAEIPPVYRHTASGLETCHLYRWDGEKASVVYVHSRHTE